MQVHDLEFAPTEAMLLNETLPALNAIRYSGKARYIGVTGYALERIKSALIPISIAFAADSFQIAPGENNG